MKKKLLGFFLMAVLIVNLSVPAFAASGDVTFTAEGKMEEKNFNVDQVFEGLEPGDDATYTVNIHNRNSKTTRWYMSNTVLKSLEDGYKIGGGAYTYVLSYTGPRGTKTTIYDSRDRANSFVGGTSQGTSDSGAPSGMHQATSNLQNYFFLDTLNANESGTVTLYVALEGETQDNSYQNTAARIQMNFAVELSNSSTNTNRTTAVKTGDENNLIPYYAGMIVAGLLLLYLALDDYTDRKFSRSRKVRAEK